MRQQHDKEATNGPSKLSTAYREIESNTLSAVLRNVAEDKIDSTGTSIDTTMKELVRLAKQLKQSN